MFSGFDGGHPNNLAQTLWPLWPPIPPTLYQRGPIFSLPVRALQKVFLYACDTYAIENQMPDLWIGRARDVMMAPIILSHVCKRWRNIANTTPRLWRNVVVRFTPGTSTSATEVLEEFIMKSDPYTINVCFLATPELPQLVKYSTRDTGRHITEEPPRLFHEDGGCATREQRALRWPVLTGSDRSMELINTVTKSSRRWERVFFSGSMTTYEELFCRGRPALYLPELSNLEVPKGGGPGAEKNSLFGHAYALRGLRITGTTFAHYVLPWNGLRVLHVAITQDIEILEMLVHCPHLEELVIQDPWAGHGPALRHVLLPKLQLLSFTTYTRRIDDAPLRLMDRLITPSILEIRFSDIGSKSPFTRALQNISQLLRRSCACRTLQRIYLMSVLIIEEDLIDLLNLTQSLVSLHIDLGPTAICIPSTKTLLARLSNTGDFPPFLPHLRAFTCFGIQFAVKDLLTALHARSKSTSEPGGTVIHPLRDVHIHLPHSAPLSPAMQIMVDSLRECGAYFEMNSPGVADCGCFRSSS